MVMRTLAGLLPFAPGKTFDALQVEITTHCFLRCFFCPHEALRSSWTPRHMPLTTFQRLIPAFRRARFVHLQGWGEPLLHPDVLTMIEMAKSAGCRVGFTTNAALLGEETARRLLNTQLDLIAVSVAGADPGTHAAIRAGSQLSTLVENVAALARLKKKAESKRPKIVVSFLMLRRNLAELPDAVDMAAAMGAQELVTTNLDYLVNEEHDAAKAFSMSEPDPAFVAIVDEARRRATRRKLTLRPYPLAAQSDVLICEAMPTRNAVVAADGGVFPCVYLSPPVDPLPRRFGAEQVQMPRRPFGSIATDDLLSIWQGAECREFRRALRLRRAMSVQAAWDGLLAPRGAAAPSPGEGSTLAGIDSRAPLPPTCSTCYKAYGL